MKHLSHGDFAEQVGICAWLPLPTELVASARLSPRLTAHFLEVLDVRFDDLLWIAPNVC